MAGLEAAGRSLQFRAVDDALGGQPRAIGGGQVALGDKALDQDGNTDIAHARFDGRALTEGGPAAFADQTTVTHIAGGQVGIADIGRSQSLEPVDETVLGQGVVQPDGQVDAVLLHLPQILDGLGADPAFGQNAAVAEGGGGGAHLGRVTRRREGLEIEEVVLGETVAFGAAGCGLKGAETLGRPDGTPAVQLVEGAHIGLDRCGQAGQLVVETVIEGDSAGVAGLGPGRQSNRRRESRHGRAKSELPSIHRHDLFARFDTGPHVHAPEANANMLSAFPANRKAPVRRPTPL